MTLVASSTFDSGTVTAFASDPVVSHERGAADGQGNSRVANDGPHCRGTNRPYLSHVFGLVKVTVACSCSPTR